MGRLSAAVGVIMSVFGLAFGAISVSVNCAQILASRDWFIVSLAELITGEDRSGYTDDDDSSQCVEDSVEDDVDECETEEENH